MTPTEQDNELREQVAIALRTGYHGIAETKVINRVMKLINSEVAKALERLEQFIEAESGKSGRKEIIAAIQDLKEEYKPMTNYNKGVCADCGEHCEMEEW